MTKATVAAGLPKPYIVAMGWGSPQTQMALAKKLGAEAISQYAFIGAAVNGSGPNVPNHPLPYQSNADQEAAHYAACATAGIEVLPSITAGWDPRPRQVIGRSESNLPVGCNFGDQFSDRLVVMTAPPWQHGGAPKGCNVSGVALCHVEDPTMPELTVSNPHLILT